MFLSQRLEDDNIINAVEEFGAEMILEQIFNNIFRLDKIFVGDESDFGAGKNFLRTEIARHDNHGVFKIDDAPFAVRQASVVEDLQKDVENIAVRLFDFVKENDAVGAAANLFGKLPALVVADITGRRADKSCDRVLFHVFGHVNANDTALVVEESLRQRLSQFRFADARRTQKDKRTDWAIGIFDTCAGAEDSLADNFNRLILTDNALMQSIFKVQKFFALARQHLCKRNARPAAHNLCNIFLADFFL